MERDLIDDSFQQPTSAYSMPIVKTQPLLSGCVTQLETSRYWTRILCRTHLSARLNSTAVTSSEWGTKRQVRPRSTPPSSHSSPLRYHRLSAPRSSPPASSSRPASGKMAAHVSFSSERKKLDLVGRGRIQ